MAKALPTKLQTGYISYSISQTGIQFTDIFMWKLCRHFTNTFLQSKLFVFIRFYEFNNNCQKCSRCCHGSKGTRRISKCLNDGMPVSHSCSPDPSCSNFGTSRLSFLDRLRADIVESRRRMLNNQKLAEKRAQETDRLLKKQSAKLKDAKARIEANLARLQKFSNMRPG